MRRLVYTAAAALAVTLTVGATAADTPGVTATEIKIGNTVPYSGPASSYGVLGKLESAFFGMVNEQGGVAGHKINFISLDDNYSPPKTVEQIRRLVEEEKVAFTFATLGTPTNSAIVRYMNQKKVPHLFLATGADKWGNYKDTPWTIGWQPSYRTEAQIYTKYILQQKPNAKIAILYQNDDLGKDYVRGIKRELGDRARTMIVGIQSYEITDATIDSQIVALRATGADTFIDISTPKFAAQAVRKVSDLGWHPTHMLSYASAAVAAVMKPAGVDKAVGIISSTYFKDPTDPRWANDPDYLEWIAFMDKYLPDADKTDIFYTIGYMMANSLVQLLEQCGNDLTRENVMRQVAHIDFRVPMLLPGMHITTGPNDYYPIKTLQLERFDGKSFVLFGDPITGVPNPE
jgi:branched-chain amino acid transport system substrate-binding protein